MTIKSLILVFHNHFQFKLQSYFKIDLHRGNIKKRGINSKVSPYKYHAIYLLRGNNGDVICCKALFGGKRRRRSSTREDDTTPVKSIRLASSRHLF